MSNGDLVHKPTESSPLLATSNLSDLKSKPAPNGVSPLAICQKPEVIHPILISCSFQPPPQKPDSLVLGVQKPGVGGCKVQKQLSAVSSTREVQTEEKADSWMREVESSSITGQDGHRSSHPGHANTRTSQAAQGPSGGFCTSSLPPNQQQATPCQGSNIKGPPCKEPASAPSCQQPLECQAGGRGGSVAKAAANGVRGKSEVGTPGRGSKTGHHHHQHARRLVINLDDKNKFTEEVTV